MSDDSNPIPAGSSTGNDDVITTAISDINQEFKEREVMQKARDLGISYIDVSILPINEDLLRIISEEDSIDGKIIPFFRVGKKLRVAMVDPENLETERILEYLDKEGFVINKNLCSKENLEKAQKAYKNLKINDTSVEDLEKKLVENIDNITDEIKSLADFPQKFEEIRSDLALAFLHREALSMNTSDIHFEPVDVGFRVRGRIDGVLRTFFTLSIKIGKSLIRQIKFNAKIKSNVKGVPLDGQYTFQAGEKTIMVRVSILPESHDSESIVLRILDPEKQQRKLADLGFLRKELQLIKKVLDMRDGLFLVTGPTGSGKTTTLYSMLKMINTPDRKIITLEDPVEYEIEGVVQSSIKPDEGYSFSDGLKSCLRQDPDVLLVGEIRDFSTAETALQSALTGHLVLSTLHTNSALDSLIRLKDLNIPPYLLSSGLKGIVAQRLLRKSCPHCVEEIDFTEFQKNHILKTLKPFVESGERIPASSGKMKKGKGCNKCSNTGYKGRMVVAEVVLLDDVLKNMISDQSSVSDIKDYLKQQNTLFFQQDAAIKILKGETDFDEVVRVLGDKFI